MTFFTEDSGAIFTGDSLYVTNDGGNHFEAQKANMPPWTPWDNHAFVDTFFATRNVGYMTCGGCSGITRTIDGGTSWNVMYETNYRLGALLFKSAAVGIFAQFGFGDVPQVGYTEDSLKHVRLLPPLTFNIQGQESTFLQWSDNGNWYVQYQGLVRSTDSGLSWKTVLPDDQSGTSYGLISAACFHGNRGFAFADGNGQGFAGSFETTDAGATWPQVLPTSPYIPSTFCSMPSDSVAYVIASDSARTVLLKIELPVEYVKTVRNIAFPLVVSSSGTEIRFRFGSELSDEKIEVFDVLGRKCAELPLPPMSTNALLPASALRAGTYFALLGNSVAKFIVW